MTHGGQKAYGRLLLEPANAGEALTFVERSAQIGYDAFRKCVPAIALSRVRSER